MKEIQEIINKKVQQMVDDNTIKEAIENGIEQAIKKAISSQFENYGAITKQLEEALEKGLRINQKDLPFESYNAQMLVAVKSRVGSIFQGEASKKFMAEIDKTLDPAPIEMTINQFVEKIVAIWKTNEPWDADDLDDYATVEVNKSNYNEVSYKIKIWKKKIELYSENQADIELYLIDGKICISHNQSYNPTCFSEHETFIFKLYAAGTVITEIGKFDADDCDLALKEY